MDLTVNVVDWGLATALYKERRLEEAMRSDEVDGLYVGDAPGVSQSCVLYMNVVTVFLELKKHWPIGIQTKVDTIMANLINENFRFPHDLGPDIDPGLVAGSISPRTINELIAVFAQLDFADLDSPFDMHLPPAMRALFVDCHLRPSQEMSDQAEFFGYLRQWQSVLEFAHQRDAGILIHLG